MAEQHPHKTSSGRRTGSFFTPCPRGLLALVGGAACAALLVGIVLVAGHVTMSGFRYVARTLTPPVTQPVTASLPYDYDVVAPWRSHIAPEPEQAAEKPQPQIWHAGLDTYARGPLSDDALPFSEIPDAPLTETIKQIDYILIQTMLRLGLGVESCMLVSHERRTHSSAVGSSRRAASDPSNKPYLFQRLRFYLPPSEADRSPQAFARILQEMLGIWSDRAQLHTLDASRLRIEVDGVTTHELFLFPIARERLYPRAADAPMLTIVIDDMGASPEAAERLLGLDVPLTFSIWPRAAHAASVAEAAWKKGHEIIIHQPCEPIDYPTQKPGPGAIFTSMSRDEITRIFTANITRVPHAVGVNNHMGSRFTMDRAASAVLCDVAAHNGLFVLDSVTTPRSVLAAQAASSGITSYRRAVFLDDPLSKKAVHAALQNAERIARTQGQAIAIGHPHNETIEALREWLPMRDTSIVLVPLRLQKPEASR